MVTRFNLYVYIRGKINQLRYGKHLIVSNLDIVSLMLVSYSLKGIRSNNLNGKKLVV